MSSRGEVLAEPYPIVEVKPEWTIEDEAMGGREKFWYEIPDDQQRWLFKYPRAGTGEHWAEKIAAEVADGLGILHAAVDLAVFRGERGSVTRSFARRRRELSHGNELLAWHRPYDAHKRFGQSDHTAGNILEALEAVFTTRHGARTAKRQFAGYLVLDALIGNTDRHHENWGLLLRWIQSRLHGFLAPTFDHASSLGRELSDQKRRARLANENVGDYSERGRGGVFWTNSGRYGPSPLELVRRSAAEYPDLFGVPLVRVRERRSRFEEIVRAVPSDWMSPTAKDFTVALLDYNARELKRCLM